VLLTWEARAPACGIAEAAPGARQEKAWEGIMADENFSDNLLRAVASELHLLNRMTAAREMFSKSYFSLGVVEKATVDQTVMSMVAGIYQSFTPEALASRKAQEPIGFRASEETKS
jgi:hypothetical protein